MSANQRIHAKLQRMAGVLIVLSLLLGTVAPVVQAQGTIPPTSPATQTADDAVALRVTATTPSDAASEVDVNSAIVVSFNRPVVPLVGTADQADLPQPLTITPAVTGTGEWISTSIYRFDPEPALAGATDYTVTVAQLTAVGGETMEAPFTFAFSTSTPLVTSWTPSQTSGVAPDSAVSVTFSQAMDQPSSEAAFALVSLADDTPVEGAFTWNEGSTTLTFTPTIMLEFGATYAMEVATTAQPASQVGTLRAPFHQEFSVVPLPSVVASTPTQDATNVPTDQQVSIRFASPMSGTMLLEGITISPLLTTTSVYSYYNSWDGQVVLDWWREANTAYTVTVSGDVEDLYGNLLGEDYSLTFSTGDMPAFTRLGLERYTHFSPYEPSLVSVYYRNLTALQADLYALPLEEFVDVFQDDNAWQTAWSNYQMPDPEDNLIWTQTYTTSETLNETFERVVWLQDEAGEPLAPGIYLLDVYDPNVETPAPVDDVLDSSTPPTRAYAVIVISGSNITLKKSIGGESLAWVTDIATGEPVAGVEVTFQDEDTSYGTVTTGEDGVAQGAVIPADVSTSWLSLVASVGEPGDEDFALASTDWSSGISTYDFNISGGYNLEEYPAVFYTERPIYQPGQTVFWRGILRHHVNDQLEVPDSSIPVTVTVRNQLGEVLTSGLYNPGAYGTLQGEVQLPPDSGTGWYYLEASLPGNEYPVYLSGASFQVAAYVRPEFNISITSDQDEYVQGDTVKVAVSADYFSGGALANVPVTWRILAYPYTFTWDKAPDGRWFSFDSFDPENEVYDIWSGVAGIGLVREGAGETNAEGNFTLEVPADLGASLVSQQWTFEFTVQSGTNQFVTQSLTAPIHRAGWNVGLSPRTYVAEEGEENTVDIAVVTHEGETVGGVDLNVTAYAVQWNSVQVKGADGQWIWQSEMERTAIVTDTLRTGTDGMASFTWTPPSGGQYQIVAQGEDSDGNSVASGVYLWAASASSDFVPWQRENNDRIDLVTDKREYAPGDTARILVTNPFTGSVQALVTIERAGVISHEVSILNGGSRTIEVPIDESLIPNFFVSVVLVKGIDESNPTPAIRVGMVELNVDTSAKVIDFDVRTETASGGETARPGEVVTYTLSLTDQEGNPAAGVETSVAIVDKALLLLAGDSSQSLLDVFYRSRPLGVTTGATLIINRDRVSQQLSDGAKGGGGGGDMGGIETREDFPDTAFWRADLVSDANGEIVFSFTLPDNLTTWQMTARGIDKESLVGEAKADVVVTKVLQIRTALPRFFTAGDRAQIGALVINTTDEDATSGTLAIQVEGATIDGEESFDLALAAGASETLRTPITVLSATDAVTFTFVAQVKTAAGTLDDAVRVVVPVEQYQSPETVATAGEVPAEGVIESVIVPSDATDDGALVVGLEPSLAAGTVEALTWLEHYEYECTEQTVSRFLPNALTVQALQTLGIDSSDLASRLAYQVGIGEQRLISRQNADGGWGYWQGESSNPFITAYVLWGLWTIHQADRELPQYMQRAVGYLDRSFVAISEVEDNWKLNEMAFMHYVLAQIGEADPGRMSTLYDVRERLGNYGKALLAMALAQVEADDARVGVLLDDLRGAVNESATGAWWQEDEVDWQTLNTDLRSTAIVLDAFATLAPDETFLPAVVRWLMNARQAATWSSTQENAWAIIALTDWMAASGELEGAYTWNAALNGGTIGAGDVTAENLAKRVELTTAVADLLRDEANTLTLARDNDSGALYYTAHLRYNVDALAVQALDRGIVVDRTFRMADDEGNVSTVSSAAVGDVISVTVTVIAPTDLHQVRVDVPIPAGAEILDPNLNTMPQYDDNGNLIQVSRWDQWNPTWLDYQNEKVSLFQTYLPAGTWMYTFQMRATVAGEFRVLPAYAEMMYFTETWGRSSGALFTVTE